MLVSVEAGVAVPVLHQKTPPHRTLHTSQRRLFAVWVSSGPEAAVRPCWKTQPRRPAASVMGWSSGKQYMTVRQRRGAWPYPRLTEPSWHLCSLCCRLRWNGGHAELLDHSFFRTNVAVTSCRLAASLRGRLPVPVLLPS